VKPIFTRIQEAKDMQRMAEFTELWKKKQAAEEAFRSASAKYRNESSKTKSEL
jgi:hypothetical protein